MWRLLSFWLFSVVRPQCGQLKIFIYFLFLFYKNLIYFRYFLLDKLAKICCVPLKYLNLRRNYI